MSEDSKLPGLYELICKWVYSQFGIPGLVVLHLLVAIIPIAVYAYLNWNTFKTLPGIIYFTRESVPKADPNRFSVLVAHLENDFKQEHEHLIVEAIKEFKGIQVLSLDRIIPLKGPVPEEMEKRGHEKAHRFLNQSSASVLIWGTVLNRGGSTALKLYWTLSHGWMRKPERYDAPLPEAQLRLPELFWSDLAEILRLLVALHDAEFRAQEGQYVAERLHSFIARVRRLLDASGDRLGWDAKARSDTLVILADSLYRLGEQTGQSKPLKEAVATYREVLKEYIREQAPFDWGRTQNNLGLALAKLGERESGTAHIEEAVIAFREALKEFTQDRMPLNWAGTQNNLGIALVMLGDRENGTKRLEEAVAAFREALKKNTRERVPLHWAKTQNNLGNALGILGDRKSCKAISEEAEAAIREAFKENTRERVPLEWARTQKNLGDALFRLGVMESGTKHLEEAVIAYREALKEWSRERVPLDWAMTQHNLGNALLDLGKREGGTARLREAVAVYREALQERTREKVPLKWAMTQNNLGIALQNLGEQESGTAHLEEAVAAYQEALQERTREKLPLKWASTQNNMGYALLILGERERNIARLKEAVATFKAALEIFEPARDTYSINLTKSNLRRAEALLREHKK